MRPSNREPIRAQRISIPLFVATSALVGVLWWRDWRAWEAENLARVERVTVDAALRLEDYVHARLLIVCGLARLSAERPPLEDGQRARAELAQELYGGFQAINWLDARGVIQMVTPHEPNREALQRNVRDHPLARAAFERARASGEPHMTGGLDLFQGGRGFATYYPFENEGTRGYVNGVFRAQPLVETALRGSLLEDYAIGLEDDTGARLLALPEALATSERPASVAELRLLDRTWRLRTIPRDPLWARMESARPDLVYLMVLLLLALVAASTHRALRGRFSRLQAEARQLELERRLERGSKLESLGRLAGGVAHDFNNVLTAILHAVGLLERQALDEAGDAKRALDIIAQAAGRATELTRQLLAFARQDEDTVAEPVPVDLNGELTGMQRMLDCLVPPTAVLELDLAETLAPVRIAISQLGRAVVNLVVNAADALPESGGHIVLRTRQLEREVSLEVEDDGAGMDAETRARIFEPFFTTKEEGEGTGLGLATVQAIVTEVGGTIEVQSAPGEGTRLLLRFPVKTEAHDREATGDEG